MTRLRKSSAAIWGDLRRWLARGVTRHPHRPAEARLFDGQFGVTRRDPADTGDQT